MDVHNTFDLVSIFANASLVTLEVALLSILLAIFIGFVSAVILFYEIRVLKTLIKAYVAFLRNTPSLIQAYFIFYGLPKVFLTMSSFICSVIVLSLLGGAYMCEAILSGMKAITASQRELAMALGLSRLDTIRYLILPQAVSTSIAAICNNAMFLTKEVSAMKLILLPEIVYQAFAIISLRPDLITAVAAFMILSYLIILIPMTYLFSKLERKIRFAEFGS
ncbi:MAG: amino acid ABC transporter permease [Burkholderiales bacterium]